MITISIRNKEILTKLNEFSDWLFNQDLNVLQIRKDPITKEQAVSEEYFQVQHSRGVLHTGFPEHMFGIDLSHSIDALPQHMQETVRYYKYKFNDILGSKFNALMAYYPPKGYIAWHNNWNVPGLNLLFTYSKTGDGYFIYKDPLTLESTIIPDEIGWSCKMGYYGSHDEKDKICWHAAETECDRITISYVIPDLTMWEMLREELEEE